MAACLCGFCWLLFVFWLRWWVFCVIVFVLVFIVWLNCLTCLLWVFFDSVCEFVCVYEFDAYAICYICCLIALVVLVVAGF